MCDIREWARYIDIDKCTGQMYEMHDMHMKCMTDVNGLDI